MIIDSKWLILAFFIPSVIVGMAKNLIFWYLKKRKGKISKADTMQLNREMMELRGNCDSKIKLRAWLLFVSLLLFLMLLSMFLGVFTVENYRFNPFYRSYSYIFCLLALSSYSLFLIANYYFWIKSIAIWKTEEGKEFIRNHSKLLVMSKQQKKLLKLAHWLAIFLSLLNILMFYFNV